MKLRRNFIKSIISVFICFFTIKMQAQLANCTTNNIGGTVFQEFYADGIQDANEAGIEGIMVNAYDKNGLVSSSTTLSDGSYALDNLVGGVTYRIEFIWTATYLEVSPVGTNSNTAIQFVSTGNCNTDLGLYNPGDYCQDNPRVYTSCYQDYEYDGDNAAKDALVSWEYNEGGGNNSTSKVIEGTHEDVGAVWGLAYHRSSQNLLWAAFMKRHVSFGSGGIGTIYRKDISTGTISPWVDLDNLLGTGTLGTDPHPAGTDLECDANAWDPVGKRSFGDLEISDDQSTLYTINLNDKTLYKIDISNFPATPTIGDINSISIPVLNAAGISHIPNISDPNPNANMRPFGLGFHNGLLYVGLVYSAESTQNATDMHAYVYTFDPATNLFNTSAVLDFPLNYPRGCAVNLCATQGGEAEWNPWVTDWTINDTRFSREKVYPQAWLTDIEFTDDNYMVLALRDRFGDQTGYNQQSTSCSSQLYHGDVAGDLLMAAPNAGTWTLESGGSVGTKTASGSEGSTQGPGNAEFFWRDYFYDSGFDEVLHEETSMGSVLILSGKNEVVSTNYDVSRDFQGGIAYFSTDDGIRNSFVELYRSSSADDTTFGKGGGLGDLEAACVAAPIEIGNYVWEDADKDGIQDPDEIPLPNVNIQLYIEDPNNLNTYILVGKTSTDASGNYLFNDANVDMNGVSPINGNPSSGNYTGLNPFTTYYISINDSAQYDTAMMHLSLSGKDYELTTQNANSNANDQIDSDAALSPLSGTPFENYPTIVASIMGTGQNDHSFDFGFYEMACDVLLGLSATNNELCSSTESVDFTITYQTGASGDFRLVYNNTPLTTTELYANNGTPINTNVTTTANQNYTLESNFSFPQNTTNSPITYYIYSILDAANPALNPSSCIPVASTSIVVYPETPTATFSSTNQLICSRDNGAAENILDLNSLISSGSTTGTWTDTNASGGLSGSIFTASSAIEGNLYNFTYTISGSNTTAPCNDQVYQIFIQVENCPCTANAIELCSGESWDAVATIGTSNFQWYKDNVAIVGATSNTYTITTIGEYYYTAEDANACAVELNCRIMVSDGMPSATLSSNIATVCNVDLGANDQTFDLSSLVVLGDMSGTWIDTDNSGSLVGSIFTATNGQAGNTYTLSYQLTAPPPCANNSYPVMLTVQNCSCPSLNKIIVPQEVCEIDFFSIFGDYSSNPDNLAIYYNNGPMLSANDLYSPNKGGASLLRTINSPTGTSASVHGNSLSAGTYNLYLILDDSNPEYDPATCTPMAVTTITVLSATPAVTIDNPPTICNVDLGANDNQLDLNSLISQGTTAGTWNDDDATGGLAGNIFSASTVGSFQFTYTAPGTQGSGDGPCNDDEYTINVMVQDCSCPILNLANEPTQTCSSDNFNLDFIHSSNPNDLELYYYLDDGTGLTASQLYDFAGGNGGATAITTINPAANANSTTTTIALPQNTTGTNISYLIYGILANGNPNYNNGVCEPVAMTSILVEPETPTATLTTSANICEADFGNSENVIDLNTLITSGDNSGTWLDTDGTGKLLSSFFTADASDAGNIYTFTYMLSGVSGAGSGNCNDRIYPITINIDLCTVPCPSFTDMTVISDICSDEDFDITIEFESGIGNLDFYYGNEISLTPTQFYNDNSALTLIASDVATTATSHTITTALLPNTSMEAYKIYIYAALASGNPNFNDPYCMPLRTYIINQNPSISYTATAVNTSDCNTNDGQIIISDLSAETTYQVSYLNDGMAVGPTAFTSNTIGEINIPDLNAGAYTNITVSINACDGMAVDVNVGYEDCCSNNICLPIVVLKQ